MTTSAATQKDIQKLQRLIVDALEDVKAQDIVVFNTEHLSPLFERVIIATGTSNRQTKSLASSVRDKVREAGLPKPRLEGEDNGEWIIVDCGPAVVHIMQQAIRQYYHLEEIWGDKPVRLKLGAPKPLAPVPVKAAPTKDKPKSKSAKAAPAKTAARPTKASPATTARKTSVAPAKKSPAKKTIQATGRAKTKASGSFGWWPLDSECPSGPSQIAWTMPNAFHRIGRWKSRWSKPNHATTNRPKNVYWLNENALNWHGLPTPCALFWMNVGSLSAPWIWPSV